MALTQPSYLATFIILGGWRKILLFGDAKNTLNCAEHRASWKMSRSMYYVGCLFKTLALNMKMRRTLFLPKGVVLKMFCFVHAASTHNWPKLSLEFISLSLDALLFTLDEHNNRDKKIAGKLSPKTSQLSCFLLFSLATPDKECYGGIKNCKGFASKQNRCSKFLLSFSDRNACITSSQSESE